MKAKQPQKQTLAISLGLIVWLGYFYLKMAYTEDYFSLYPGIDTIYPPKFSGHKLNQIYVGMPRKEVLELLGEHSYKGGNPSDTKEKNYGIRPEDEENWADTNWGYGIDGGCRGWCDLAWVTYSIYFNNSSPNAKVKKINREVFLD